MPTDRPANFCKQASELEEVFVLPSVQCIVPDGVALLLPDLIGRDVCPAVNCETESA